MFLTRLILSDAPEPDKWLVERPLVWSDNLYGQIIVPEGFTTDLASIPRLFRSLPDFDPNGISRRPAVVHDYLYASQIKPKALADAFLRDALKAEGATSVAAAAYYYAVHWFGAKAWDCYTKISHPENPHA